MQRPNTIRRIMGQLIVQQNGCCTWPGAKDKVGYARVKMRGQKHLVHRLMYEHFVGPIPEGLQMDHLCGNKACANFAHLEAVTAQVNTLRSNNAAAQNAAKTHCKNGHEFTPENTRPQVRKGKVNGRICHVCRNEKGKLHESAKRAEQRRQVRLNPNWEAEAHEVRSEAAKRRWARQREKKP